MTPGATDAGDDSGGRSEVDGLFRSLGQLGRDLLAVDWAATPLGPLPGWPQSLKSTLQVMLRSRFSMWMAWGPELTFFANEAYCRTTLGRKYPWALGRPANEVWSEIWADIGPRIERVLRTGVASWDESLFLILERSGFPEETYHTFSYSPLADESGTTVGMLCVVSEETSRVVAQRRMRIVGDLGLSLGETRTEDAVYATVARELGRDRRKIPFSLVYRLDEDGGSARLVSAAGVEPGEPVAPLSLPLDGSSGSWPVAETLTGTIAVVDDLAERFGTVPGGDWSEPVASAVVLPLVQAEGRPFGVLVAALNRFRPFDHEYEGFLKLIATEIAASITNARAYESERRRAEALTALDQAKTAFLTNVSHEFRTPLTLMIGPLEDAIEAAADDPEATQRLEMVHRNSRRLLRMVNSLLDFARLEAGEAPLQPVRTDLGARTAEIAASFSDICQRAGIDLVLDCAPVNADVDIEAWETIVLNLLSNAFKFTFAGSIEVRVAASEPGTAALVVADTGTGIALDDLDRIFERFYRPPTTQGRSAEGTGIGLALVRSLVERQHGTIGISSDLGRGTTVTIRLPARSASAADPVLDGGRRARSDDNAYVTEAWQWLGDDRSAGAAGARSGRPVVLVADDNEDMRRQLARVLGTRFDVALVNDGEQALAHIRRDRPDLVVADVTMPVLDGFGLVAAIRADPALSTLPVLVLSARAGEESAGEGFEAGADDYIVKPFRSADLLARVTARIDAVQRARVQQAADEIRARRAAAIGELGTRLGGVTAIDGVLQAVLGSPPVEPAAAWAAIGLVERPAGLIRMTFGGDVHPLLADRYHIVAIDAALPVADGIRRDATLVLADRLPFDDGFEQQISRDDRRPRSSVTVPIRARDRSVLGGLVLGWAGSRPLDPDEVAQIEEAASLVSMAVERIRIAEREHRLAIDLQERLLDFEVTSKAAVVHALYQPAGEESRIGGDWYTATTLDGGVRVAVSVGDMAGHGLPATAAMSQVRSALEAVALTTSDPGVVIDVIARFAATIPGSVYATLAYAIVDGDAHQVHYACAGHPYPLIVLPDGSVRFLVEGRRPTLGSRPTATPTLTATTPIPGGSLLLLYTDGLVERRGESLDEGLARLARAAASLTHVSTGEACTRLVRELAPDNGFADDVALVALRPSGAHDTSFVDVLAAAVDEIGPARRRLRSWLADLDVEPGRAYEILLGVGEAVNNAVEHGSGFDPRQRVMIEAFAVCGTVTVSITDRGCWKRDTAASRRELNRGKGLTLMHEISDGIDIVRDTRGTRVTLTFAPSGTVGG